MSQELNNKNRGGIEIRQFCDGWTVTYYSDEGHVRHLVTAPSELQAYRVARQMAAAWRLTGRAYVIASRGEFTVDLSPRLLG